MLGMGMTLKVEDFILVWKSPFLIGLGVILRFLIMPAWGSFLAWSLSLPKEIAVGLILVSCCPGGTASNVVVFLARANVALSLSLTLMSTLLCCYNPMVYRILCWPLCPGRCVGFIKKHSFDRAFAPLFRFSLEKVF